MGIERKDEEKWLRKNGCREKIGKIREKIEKKLGNKRKLKRKNEKERKK